MTRWTSQSVLEVSRGYQAACVLSAAVDLDVFGALAPGARTADQTAGAIGGDPRATAVLLDALVALELLTKDGDRYAVPEELLPLLAQGERPSVRAMARHQGNCLRRWAQLAEVVRRGVPAARAPSVQGEQADHQAFITAMDDVSAPVADDVVGLLADVPGRRLLDVGGASGTWTAALLLARPDATATLFDLPEVLPLATERLTALDLIDRVTLVPGDYLADPLPAGHDLAWLSAIVHQQSREEIRRLLAATHAALEPGGHVVIRDVLMEPSRTAPPAGALFAVNMLVATEAGGTCTAEELGEDLAAAGFGGPRVLHRDPGMNSLLAAPREG